MKNKTLLLKIALFLIGVPVLVACVFLFPGANLLQETDPGPEYLQYFVWYMYVSVIPFFFALFQAYQLLRHIDMGEACSDMSLKSIKTIKHCSIIICVMYTAVLPVLFYLALAEDAPGLVLFGLVPAFVSFIVMVVAAIMQKLFITAIDEKNTL
jgi:hypothetical protein